MECNQPLGVAPPAAAILKTLLVVDDDDEIRELLCDYLSETGYHVLAAADAKAAAARLKLPASSTTSNVLRIAAAGGATPSG